MLAAQKKRQTADKAVKEPVNPAANRAAPAGKASESTRDVQIGLKYNRKRTESDAKTTAWNSRKIRVWQSSTPYIE